MSPDDPIQDAIRRYIKYFSKIKGVVNVAPGFMKTNKGVVKCIQVNVENSKSAIFIRNNINRLRIRKDFFIPVNLQVTGKPELRTNGSTHGIIEKGIGNSIYYPDELGSLGCFVRDKYFPEKKFILTCYHVVNGDDTWDNNHVKNSIVNYKNEVISTQYNGFLNNHLDTALVEVTDEIIHFYRSLNTIGIHPEGVYEVTENDVYSKEVFVNGYKTTNTPGTIIHNSWPASFPYGNKLINFEDIILIAHINPDGSLSTVTQGGDSGSLVLDQNNHAVGIIFAGDFVHSYAIKMTTILNELGLELIN